MASPRKKRRIAALSDDEDQTLPATTPKKQAAPPLPDLRQLSAHDPDARRKARRALSKQSTVVLRDLISHDTHCRSITDLLFLRDRYVIQLEAAYLLTKKIDPSILAEQQQVVAALIRAVQCFAENGLAAKDVDNLLTFVEARVPVQARCNEDALKATLSLLRSPQCEHLQARVLRRLLLPIVSASAETPGVSLSLRRHRDTWEAVSKSLLCPSAPENVALLAKRVQEKLYSAGGAGRGADRAAFDEDFHM